MELVNRQIVVTIRVTNDDAVELAALMEGIDRVLLSHPELKSLLDVGVSTLNRLVQLVD